MKRFLLVLCALWANLYGAWVMFSDGADTYIYNNSNGDIYLRHKEGEFQGRFVKMPPGEIPENLKSPKDSAKKQDSQKDSAQKTTTKSTQEESIESLQQKFRDLESNLLNKALE